MTKTISFVSIDSSLSNTGIAIGQIAINHNDVKILVDAIFLHETVKTTNKQIRASSDSIQRCRSTHEFVHGVLNKLKPNIVFAETPSGSQSANGMKSYGVTCQLLGSITPPPIEVTPIELKKATVGRKSASKTDIINWAYNKYPMLKWQINQTGINKGKLKNKNEHMADAIGVVYAGILTNEFKRMIKLW